MTGLTISRRGVMVGGVAGGLLAMVGAAPALAQGNARTKLTVAMSGFPPSIEPALATHTATRRIAPQIFDTLIAFDHANNMALKPALAQSWERVDDKSVRFVLREGVKFHDGGVMTADDVAFSLSPERLQGPNGGTTALQILSTLAGTEVEDEHTIVVRTNIPDALLEQRLASWGAEIVSRAAFKQAGSWQTWTWAPVGTGPYRIVSQQLDVNVVLEANDDYWGGLPPYTGIEYRIVPELASRVNALVAGEVEFITDLTPDQFKDLASHAELEVAGGPVQNIRLMNIDTTGPILGDVRIRRALSLAIDRKLLVEALWDDRLPVPNGFQLPGFGPGYIADHPALAYDPDAARKLVQEAGYDGTPISYRLLNNYYPNQVSGAQILIEMWKQVGLKVEITMMENFTQIETAPINAIYDNSATAIFPDHLGQAWRIFGTTGGMPKIGIWKNQEYFDLGDRLAQTIDTDERRKILARMLDIIDTDDPPCIILHVSGQFYGKRKDMVWAPRLNLDLDFGPLNPALVKA